MLFVQKLPTLEPEMRDALRHHIMRKRQRLKQELEQDAIERRMKKERELKKQQDAMTLDQIREHLSTLEKRLECLKEEKNNLFMQLKQVMNEDSSNQRKQNDVNTNDVDINITTTTITSSKSIVDRSISDSKQQQEEQPTHDLNIKLNHQLEQSHSNENSTSNPVNYNNIKHDRLSPHNLDNMMNNNIDHVNNDNNVINMSNNVSDNRENRLITQQQQQKEQSMVNSTNSFKTINPHNLTNHQSTNHIDRPPHMSEQQSSRAQGISPSLPNSNRPSSSPRIPGNNNGRSTTIHTQQTQIPQTQHPSQLPSNPIGHYVVAHSSSQFIPPYSLPGTHSSSINLIVPKTKTPDMMGPLRHPLSQMGSSLPPELMLSNERAINDALTQSAHAVSLARLPGPQNILHSDPLGMNHLNNNYHQSLHDANKFGNNKRSLAGLNEAAYYEELVQSRKRPNQTPPTYSTPPIGGQSTPASQASPFMLNNLPSSLANFQPPYNQMGPLSRNITPTSMGLPTPTSGAPPNAFPHNLHPRKQLPYPLSNGFEYMLNHGARPPNGLMLSGLSPFYSPTSSSLLLPNSLYPGLDADLSQHFATSSAYPGVVGMQPFGPNSRINQSLSLQNDPHAANRFLATSASNNFHRKGSLSKNPYSTNE